MTIVETHELRDRGVVRSGAKGATERGPVEQNLQSADDGDCRDELDERQDADPYALGKRKAGHLDRARIESPAVGGEQLKQTVLDDDREAERNQQRRQKVIAQCAVEERALKQIANSRHKWRDESDGRQRI